MRVLLMVVLMVGLCGCASANDTVTDGDRGLTDQNKKAATFILDTTKEPATKSAAQDIKANSERQEKNWGPPKDKSVIQDYTPKASQENRERSEKEHKEKEGASGTIQAILAAVAVAAGWFLRSTSLGSVPVVGQLLSMLSPRLANGAAKNEAVLLALQTAMDKGRDILDKGSEALRAKIQSSSIPENVKAEILERVPSGEVLVEIIRKALGDKGLMQANTALYEKNDTGVA